MPANDVYLANLRADGHKVRLYYGKFDGSVVLNASVSATPADQALDLAITVNSGSAASVRRGWLVRVETAGGLLKGITNVRAAGTISATNLPIRELGQSDTPIVSGDVVKVYNLPYLGDKIPTDTAAFAPDNLTYVDQGTAVPPRVNSGGHFIGMVDSGQSYATVAMRGSLSSSEDPDSGGTITHLWTLLTGTLTFAPGSVSTDADPTLRASVGYGIAEHTVTDSSNSKAWTQYVCTQVYNDATPPYRLIDAELSADEATGWSGAMQTYAYSGLSDLYDGQFGGVFARETINGVTISYGSDVPNRSHIKLLGFLSRDENDLDPQLRRIHLNLQSPWQRLASLPGFSKVFTREGEDWSTIAGLTVRLALLHLIRYYSFYMEFFDLRFDSAFLNKLWSKYYLNKQTADQQIRELADGVDARVVSLRTGEMLVHTHPALIPLADRAAITTTLTIAEQDCLTAPFTRDHWKVVETFELRGFVAGAADNATVFSRYPGLAPGRGAQSLAAERIIADSQSDANERCGRRAARADGVFFNSSNVYSRAVEWDVTLPGSYDVFDFNKEYIQTGLTGTSNLRGVDLSAQNYYLSRMRITYQGGTARVNPTFLTATNAPAGATYVPSDETLPPYTPPDDVPMPPVIGFRIPPWNGELPIKGVICSAVSPKVAMAVSYTVGVSSVTLTYEDRSGNLAALGVGFCVWAYSNPYHYRVLYVLTDIGLCGCDDINATTPVWTLLKTNLALFGDAARVGHQAFGSHMRNGWGMVLYGGSAAAVTFDAWATVTLVNLDDGTPVYTTPNGLGSAWLCGHDVNHLYATVGTVTAGPLYFVSLYHSTDGGLNWTFVPIADALPAWNVDAGRLFVDPCQADISIPYTKPGGSPNRDDGALVIDLLTETGSYGSQLRSLDGGQNFDYLAGVGWGLSYRRICNPIAHFTHDSSHAYFLEYGGGSSADGRVRETSDNFATSTLSTSLYNTSYGALNGWSPNENVAILWNAIVGGGGTRLFVTFDHGATWLTCNNPPDWTAASPEGIAYAEFSLFTIAGMPQ